MSTAMRFVPWARRGLAAALDSGGGDAKPIPAHGSVEIDLVVADAGTTRRPVHHSVTLFGPGDVVGIDPTLIIRRTPVPNVTDAEPNYLAAMDFDPPDLPWVFTPTGPTAGERLRPWLALVVVEARDGVSIGPRAGAPLHVLDIATGAADELWSLDDSWAWAHTQVVRDTTATTSTVHDLDGAAEMSSSRAICPRRLDANRSYLACLVPAFKAGVDRGLGREPSADVLEPAWDGEDRVALPVYDSWRFATGARGDFESLATRIRPHAETGEVGRTKMHVASLWPGVDLDQTSPDRFLSMDGALQSPGLDIGGLDDVSTAVTEVIEEVVETDAEKVDDSEGRAAVGPPLYLGRHAGQASVEEDGPEWFRELNLDPLARAAAGLGAEVVRRNQEEFVHAAWEQVGAVREANRRLSYEALVAQIGRRFFVRHIEPRPDAGMIRFAAPMAHRAPLGDTTVPGVVGTTSLPDATLDASMRRLVSANNRHFAKASRRVGVSTASPLFDRLAAGSERVDPTRFRALAIEGLAEAAPPIIDAADEVDLTPIGLGVSVSKEDGAAVIAALNAGVDAAPVSETNVIEMRPDLQSTGVMVGAHLDAVREFNSQPTRPLGIADAPIFELIESEARETTNAAGFVLDGAGPIVGVAALRIRTRRTLTATPPSARRPRTPVVRARPLPPGSISSAPGAAAGATSASFSRAPTVLATARPSAMSAGRIVRAGTLARLVETVGVLTPDGRIRSTPVDTESMDFVVPGLVKDAVVIAGLETAFRRTIATTGFAEVAPPKKLVPFDVTAAATVLRERNEPLSRRLRRLDATVGLGPFKPSDLVAAPAGRWSIATGLDRVWATPKISVAANRFLSGYDPDRLCPGVGSVPIDSVTLLETNPRFVAAFLGGMNHEMNRELIWRGHPTEPHGTPFASFWGRTDGTLDIAAHQDWQDVALVEQTTAGPPKLVLLARGDLFQRYRNTLVVAKRERADGTVRRRAAPVFVGGFDPDVAFFGFDLELAQLEDDPESWIFAFIEPAGEPRFGLDVTTGDRDPAEPPTEWPDVAWPDVGVEPGSTLRVSDLDAVGIEHIGNSDVVAEALYQRPFAIEFRAIDLVRGLGPDA
jgi:hypothetical protein